MTNKMSSKSNMFTINIHIMFIVWITDLLLFKFIAEHTLLSLFVTLAWLLALPIMWFINLSIEIIKFEKNKKRYLL